MLDETLRLELRQPGVDGPGRRCVHPEEAILEQADHLVAVARLVAQQLQQVEPQCAVLEDGRHTDCRASTASEPETVRPRSCPLPSPTDPRTRRTPGRVS